MRGGPQNAVLLLGPTASGKTPLGNLIAERGIGGRRCHHFDFGDELRTIAAGGGAGFCADEVTFIRRVLTEGLLLEDRQFPLARKIIRAFLRRTHSEHGDLVILNGLPRHRGQAEGLEEVVFVRSVLVLECAEQDVLSRIRENAEGDRDGRVDDGTALVRKKIAVFRERTLPLIGYYREQGASVLTVRVAVQSGAESMYHDIISRGGTVLPGAV